MSMEANATVYKRRSDPSRVMIKTFETHDNYSEGRNIRQENHYYDFIQISSKNQNICQIFEKFKD